MRPNPIPLLLVATAVAGCEPSPLVLHNGDTGEGSTLDNVQFVSGGGAFPAERDLAILFPLEADPYIRASTTTPRGSTLLSSSWVNTVGAGFDGTFAEDAIGGESIYEDWRLVSARVVPCAPVARSPALAPASVCWPIVRLVWQPVASGVNLWGVPFDAYADDRAIHALYPVQPRDRAGNRTSAHARTAVTDHLDRGRRISELPSTTLDAFDASRDDTTYALLQDLAALRDPSLEDALFQGIDMRPELMGSDAEAEVFVDKFVAFLDDYAGPYDLREMTAFSLPEGRNPAGDDTWIFIQFLSDGRTLERNSLEVYSRTSGSLLLDYGGDQAAGQATESEAVTEALESGPAELHETIVESSAQIDNVADLVTDPTEVFVPNTTCATCHRLNDLRFDFHSLSHLENRDHTVSPRVAADVAYELDWVSRWVRNGAPATLEGASSDPGDGPGDDRAPGSGDTTGDDDTTGEDDTSSETRSPERAYEPNDTMAEAALVSVPFDEAMEITRNDLDYFRLDWAGGTLRADLFFSHARGDLDLVLFNSRGEQLGLSNSVTDQEQIFLDLPRGAYVLRVEGYQSATGTYQLTIE